MAEKFDLAKDKRFKLFLERTEKEKQEALFKKAKAIYKTIDHVSKQAINDFYNSYDPLQHGGYRRTYQVRDKSYKGKILPLDNGYRVLFEYSDEFMDQGSHRDDAAALNDALDGWHGGLYAYYSRIRHSDPHSKRSPWAVITTQTKKKISSLREKGVTITPIFERNGVSSE